MYESLLQSSFLVRLLVSVIPALLVVVPLAYIAQKQEVVNRDDDNVMTTAMRFVGAAFIFIGSFANVTAWQGASSANSSLKNEPLRCLHYLKPFWTTSKTTPCKMHCQKSLHTCKPLATPSYQQPESKASR